MANSKITFPEFPPQSREEWEARIEKELKGKARSSLHWALDQNIVLDALYRQEDLPEDYSPIARQHESNQWEIGEAFTVEDAAATQKAILKALSEGVQAPQLTFPQTPGLSELEQVFKNIELDYISTHLRLADPDIWPGELMTTFLTLIQFRDKTPRDLSGSLGYDPLAGSHPPDWDALSTWLKHSIDILPGFRLLTIDLRNFSKGPNGMVEELSTALQRANSIITHLAEQGIEPATTQQLIQFQVAVGKEYLAEIAKLRALRLLVTQLFEAYGLEQVDPIIIETHFAAQAYDDDPNTNRIRATTMAMSAIIGGTDRLYVRPTTSEELPTNEAFARRLGRNLQHLLVMESHLDQVIDPAAGSYYLETMTNELGEKAWDQFRSL